MPDKLRILMLEDEPADTEFAVEALRNAGMLFSSLRVDTRVRFITALEEFRPNVILADYRLPGFDGLEALAIAVKRTPEVPFIFLSGAMGEEFAIETLHQGAADYVLKGHLNKLVPAVKRALLAADERRRRRLAEESLKKSVEMYRSLVQTIPDLVWLKDPEGVYLNCNPQFERFFGAREADIVGKTDYDFVDREQADFFREHDRKAMVAGGPRVNEEWITYASDGRRALLETIKTPMQDTEGKVIGVLGVARDITQRRQLEEALRESEAKYRSLFEAIPNPFYYKDRDGRFIGCNIAFERYLGISRDEILGRTAYDIQPKKLADVSSAADRALIDHPGNLVYEAKVRWADGSLRDVIFHKATFNRADGGLAGIAGLIIDITERKAAEDQLRKLSLAVEQSPESVVITDIDARIEYVNDAFVKTSGYSREEAIGKNPRILQSGKTSRQTYAALWDALTHERAWKGELYNRRKDGSEFIEFVHITPIRQPDGNITHYLAVKEDITEKKHMGEELDRHRHHLEDLVASRTAQLAEAREHADAANKAKSSFLANMSHEIRTPLNAVLGLARIGMRDNQGRETVKTYARISASGEHLLGVINGILDFSKIAAGKLKVEKRPFALFAVIDNVKSFVAAHQAEAKGLAPVVSLAPDLHDWVEGDSMRLAQILTNLLSNAIKFTKSGEVRLCAARDGDRVCFRVADSGIGMSEEQLARLFQSFEQADSSTTRNYGGTGLGLAISQGLAHLMGGDISVDSRPGEGSSFTLELPLPVTAVPARMSRPGCAMGEAGPRLSGLSVLAAEDVEVNRLILEDLLKHEGAGVVFAHDGQQALERIDDLGANAFDIVLMDVQMPVMDGIETARRIAMIAPDLPVIGLTAHALAEERDKCLAAGMVEHVTKPIDTDMLVAAILRHIRCGVAASDVSPPASAALPVPAAGLIDHTALLARFKGRRAFIARLAASVCKHHSTTPVKLREATGAGNRETLAFIAHSLKGVAGNLDIRPLREAAQALEAAAVDGWGDLRTVAGQLADFMEATLSELAKLENDGETGE
ncbi:MAG: PAS domain S-box protein [Proteobacteria bacterium]|nr:PAS domain S-box protein [Pseudomonadota bacterium]